MSHMHTKRYNRKFLVAIHCSPESTEKRTRRRVAIFAKACFGHPSPSKRQKLNATANAFGAPDVPRRPAYVPLRHYHRKLGAGFVTLPQMTGRRFGMPFFLSSPTLALRFRQNNGPTPSGDYQPSRSLSMAGSAGDKTSKSKKLAG